MIVLINKHSVKSVTTLSINQQMIHVKLTRKFKKDLFSKHIDLINVYINPSPTEQEKEEQKFIK